VLPPTRTPATMVKAIEVTAPRIQILPAFALRTVPPHIVASFDGHQRDSIECSGNVCTPTEGNKEKNANTGKNGVISLPIQGTDERSRRGSVAYSIHNVGVIRYNIPVSSA